MDDASNDACVCVCITCFVHTLLCRIDFAVEDALPQLVEWGLVTVSE